MPAVPEPLVSVVVSTYNRPVRLTRLLASLRAQTLGPENFEVVVVDNGSGPETAEVLAAERGRGGLALRGHRSGLARDRGRLRSRVRPEAVVHHAVQRIGVREHLGDGAPAAGDPQHGAVSVSQAVTVEELPFTACLDYDARPQ